MGKKSDRRALRVARARQRAAERWEWYRRWLIVFSRLKRQPLALPEACDLWLSPAEKARQRDEMARWIEFREAPPLYARPRRRGLASALAMLALMVRR